MLLANSKVDYSTMELKLRNCTLWLLLLCVLAAGGGLGKHTPVCAWSLADRAGVHRIELL